MTNLVEIIGRFHPLLLHLPIGILIYAYLHLGFDLYIKKKRKPVNVNFALGVGAMTAVLSAVTGYLLSQNGDYEGDLLDWHKWLGTCTAIGAVLLYVFYKNRRKQNRYYGSFTVFIILLITTGHFGGSLTHGEGFLLSSEAIDKERSIITDIPQANVFDELVMPIAKRKCLNCHNPKKKKGKLLLNTLEGWKNGGKSGQFIIPGDPANSLILKRLNLPQQEKKHMPPKGKVQLDKEELIFIEWWVGAMGSFEHKVVDLTPPDHIQKYINRKLDVSTANVPPINIDAIEELQKDGIPVQVLSKDKPWLTVNFERGRTIKSSDLNKLLKHKENIRALNLSKTNISDKMLTKVNSFVNLKHLDISLNQISNAGIKKLKDLSSLEVLNLYGTKVDAGLLEHLKFFPNLRDLYLWQTAVSTTDIASNNFPETLKINLGQDLDIFGSTQLLFPTIESAKEIFEDTLSVTLSHVAKNAKIYFTTDGQSPNHNSNLYTKPILLNHTSVIKAVAVMDGWEKSKIVSKSILKSTCIPISCKIIPLPDDKYKADGESTIIDAVKGSEQFGEGKWLGFSGQDISITLDLGKFLEINKVSFGSLQDYKSYIFRAIGSTIYTSLDGEKYEKRKEENYTQITGPEDNLVKNFIIDIPNTTARYIKLDILSQKKNPKWHADPGANSWLFIDEVVIE